MLESLRMFGLQHHDLPTMLANVGSLLRLLALDVDSRHTARIPLVVYLVSAATVCLYVYTYHVSVYWFLLGAGARLAKVRLLSLTVSSSIGVVKLLYMHFNSKKLKRMVSEYLECDGAVAPGSRAGRRVRSTLRLVKRRALVFWLLIIGNGLLYLLRPALAPGRHLAEDDQLLLGLEPLFESPNYEIAYFAECFSVLLTVYAPANFTAFIIVIVGYSEAQMLALTQELLDLWGDAQQHNQIHQHNDLTCVRSSHNASHNTNESDAADFRKPLHKSTVADNDSAIRSFRKQIYSGIKPATAFAKPSKNRILNDFIRNRLVSIIKTHAIHINLIKQVESLFKSAMAIEFILLSCSLIAELLGGLENTYMQVPFALTQVAMDCITGQKLTDASEGFEEAVYGCGWEQFDARNTRLVLVMLQGARSTLRLSAGGVTSLSYAALMRVVRAIYSAYTALRTAVN